MAFVLAAKEDIRLAIEALANLLHSYQEIYSVPTTCKILGLSRPVVYKLIKSRKIFASKLDDSYKAPYLVDARSVHLYKKKRETKLRAKANAKQRSTAQEAIAQTKATIYKADKL